MEGQNGRKAQVRQLAPFAQGATILPSHPPTRARFGKRGFINHPYFRCGAYRPLVRPAAPESPPPPTDFGRQIDADTGPRLQNDSKGAAALKRVPAFPGPVSRDEKMEGLKPPGEPRRSALFGKMLHAPGNEGPGGDPVVAAGCVAQWRQHGSRDPPISRSLPFGEPAVWRIPPAGVSPVCRASKRPAPTGRSPGMSSWGTALAPTR
jgi:hypothetical protein